MPAEADNVAIATRRLEAGTVVADGGSAFHLPHTIPEGHRFVRVPIMQGARLTSWGLPFGIATRALEPGEYVCNERILAALAARDIDFALPATANFVDTMETVALDEGSFAPGEQVAPAAAGATFEGFRRLGGRGVGTRNFVVVLATTSRANGFVRAVAERATATAPRRRRRRGRRHPHRGRRQRTAQQSGPRAQGARGLHGAPQRGRRARGR